MKSTVRFTGNTQTYQCKQLNLVTLPSDSITGVEEDSNSSTGFSLAIKDEALLRMDISKEDEDFTLRIGSISIVSESGSAVGNKATCYLQFGYPHNYKSFNFVFDPITNPGKSLVIAKTGSNVLVTYDGSPITVEKGMKGPLVYMYVKNNVKQKDFKILVNDVVYES
jgi:hypothetical protein